MGSAWAILAYGTLGGLGFLLVPRFLLWLVGFTCCGVRKHSYAAEYHSHLGVVESGSPFSCLQSTGAGGTPCVVKLGIFLFGCYFTIVLIVMKEFQDLTLVPDHHFNYSTTVVPNEVTDLVTSSLPNSTWSPSF